MLSSTIRHGDQHPINQQVWYNLFQVYRRDLQYQGSYKLRNHHDDLEIKDLQFLVSKYSNIKNTIVIGILKKDDGTANLMIAKNKEVNNFSAKEVFKTITSLYSYRGGGNDFIAQGGGKSFPDMEKIIQKIIEDNIK